MAHMVRFVVGKKIISWSFDENVFVKFKKIQVLILEVFTWTRLKQIFNLCCL